MTLDQKIAHVGELIQIFEAYIQQHPQHIEYYDSVIIHLRVIQDGYRIHQGMSDAVH